MAAAYDLPPYIDKMSVEDAVKLILLQLTGGVAPAGGGSSSAGPAMTAGPAVAATSSGSVAAGKNSISFVTSSDWVGTINGADFPASAAKSYNAAQGRSLPAIAYTRSAGTLYIDFLS